MNELEQSIREFIAKNLSFIPIPEEYLAFFSVALAGTIVVFSIVGRTTSTIMGIRSLWKRIFGHPDTTPTVVSNPARVLRAVWLQDRIMHEVEPMPVQDVSIPIISFINMKGGVGKTTLAANIGAYFQSKGGRILFIDFDYQGTLSLMVASTGKKDRLEANSFELLKNQEYASASKHIHTFDKFENVGLYAAHYVLFRDEMELFANWASGKAEYDIRFALKSILHSPDCAEQWDAVIIDCGPRFTTSTINALCASTHVVIPAILDEPSSQAVGYLSKEFEDHMGELFPFLKLLGVIPTMIAQDPKGKQEPKFSDLEEEQLIAIEDAIDKTWGEGDYVLREARIPKRAQISKNADKIAFTVDSEAKRVFGRAGDVLLERLENDGFRPTKRN